ncbi:hypothetical protein ACVWXN_005152 [Bradyrhizobium sp. i1.4.4]
MNIASPQKPLDLVSAIAEGDNPLPADGAGAHDRR